MKRTEILNTANDLIMGDRAETYGNFRDSVSAIADAFNGLHKEIPGAPYLEAKHIAHIMILLKQRRMLTSAKLDDVVDMIGYAALHGEFFIDPDQ
jgi:hypothetical protein